MPPVVWPPNVVEAAVACSNDSGQQSVNVLHFKFGTQPVNNDLVDLANEVFLNATASGPPPGLWLNAMDTAWSINSVTVTDLTGVAGQAVSTHAAVQGAATGPALPPQCALCVSWIIPRRYRGGHPRTYLPGIAQSQLAKPEGSALTALCISATGEAADNFLVAMNAYKTGTSNSVTMGSVQHSTARTPIAQPNFWPFLASKVGPRIDSQRRRSGKKG